VKRLEEVTKQFGTSEPVFVGKLAHKNSTIDFQLKHKYYPDANNYTDPVAQLLASHFSEYFDRSLKRFVHSFQFNQIYEIITDSVKEFYTEHAKLKNPRQSILYKWLVTMDNKHNHPASEGFIGLYRYIHTNAGEFCEDDTVIQNAIAILELMKEKYEVEQDTD
jgi:hypothetical protein